MNPLDFHNYHLIYEVNSILNNLNEESKNFGLILIDTFTTYNPSVSNLGKNPVAIFFSIIINIFR